MKPVIFIHVKNDLTLLKFCLKELYKRCIIIINCYGNRPSVIEFCKQNSDYFYQKTHLPNKKDVMLQLPFEYTDGVWCCNDEVEIEGDVWGMFEFANNNKNNIDLIYPPVDSSILDTHKVNRNIRHRLNSSAYFLTENGIKKLRIAQPLSDSYTYFGVTIIQSKVIDNSGVIVPTDEGNINIQPSGVSRFNILKQLKYPSPTPCMSSKSSKYAVITLSTQGRTFFEKTHNNISQIVSTWPADLIVYENISTVLTKSQIKTIQSFTSKRESIINYFAKMLCVYKALETYDRVLWIDDTSIISPFIQNLFNIVPEQMFGGLVLKRDCGLNECVNDFNFILEKYNIEVDDVYINTGVMVVSKVHQWLFSFKEILKNIDLFESFYPTQAYLVYKFTTEKIPVFDITTINHFMPAMLKYEDKLSMFSETLASDFDIVAAHSLVHFSGFHKQRELLHAECVNMFEQIYDQKITLIIMNFSRPENIKNIILPFYTSIFAIDQIIISHCKPDVIFEFASTPTCRVEHYDDTDNDKNFGLFTRFLAAKRAKNNCIVFVDDDLLVPAHVLAQLFIEWKKSPNIILGTRGRVIEYKEDSYTYSTNNITNDADIILTHCAMTSKDTVMNLLQHESFFHEIAMQSRVKWNGEDIMLSLFAKFRNQRKNKCIYAHYIDLDNNGVEICKTDDHEAVRTRLVNSICKFYTQKIFDALSITH